MPLKLEVITPERRVFEDEVDMVIVPATEGVVGILPHHAPLFTSLGSGEMRVKKGTLEYPFAVFGGFMDVRGDRVTILTDVAEHAEEIDEQRARAARDQAQKALEAPMTSQADEQRARAALQQALIRLRVAERRRGARRG